MAVFQLCTIQGIGAGMGGILWSGVTACEVRAAMALARVPLAEREQVARDAVFMGSEVAAERNRRAAAEAKRRNK